MFGRDWLWEIGWLPAQTLLVFGGAGQGGLWKVDIYDSFKRARRHVSTFMLEPVEIIPTRRAVFYRGNKCRRTLCADIAGKK